MKTVMEMAREAGIDAALLAVEGEILCWEAETKHLERFTELIRADAIADEREACAKVCDALDAMNWSEYGEYSSGYGDEIRKRGTQ